MVTLPLELIRQVVENIVDDIGDSPYRRDLSAVSLSCRLLRREGQRVLFSDSGELHTTTAAREKTIMFMETIISSPERLALYVKTFTIAFDDWFHPYSDETTAFVQKLSLALQAMRNLESLDVSQWTSSIPSLPNILQHVHSKLTSFCWFGWDTASEAANVVTGFFRLQDRIEHLTISDFIDERALKTIAAEICPRLRSLSATYPLTEILLPGKQHITSVQWAAHPIKQTQPPQDGLDADVPSNLELISTELGKIRYLSYDVTGNIALTGPNIRHLAPYLTNVVCLNTDRGSIKQVEALSQLPRLKYLVLEVGAHDNWPVEDDLMKVITSCEFLNHIDVEAESGSFVRFTYDHPSKTLQSSAIEGSDTYMWIVDFDAFDD